MIRESVKIIKNVEVASGIWEMQLSSNKLSSFYKGPRQFIQIQIENGWEHCLSKPMSIAGCMNNIISIIYKVFGNGTTMLSKKKPGDNIYILGPLGNIFSIDKQKSYVLVGGGVGLAPILNLWKKISKEHNNNYLIIGAKTELEHFHNHDPKNNIFLSTDDGSLGIRGTVMDVLSLFYEKIKDSTVVACGPIPMLNSIQKYVYNNNIKAQISVESYMGCGIGICQGCVIKRDTEEINIPSYQKKYSLVCIDGPVYKAEEIKFD